jgi:hypothetical protein
MHLTTGGSGWPREASASKAEGVHDGVEGTHELLPLPHPCRLPRSRSKGALAWGVLQPEQRRPVEPRANVDLLPASQRRGRKGWKRSGSPTEARRRAKSRRWDLAWDSRRGCGTVPVTGHTWWPAGEAQHRQRGGWAQGGARSGRGSGAQGTESRGRWPLLHGAPSASTRSWPLPRMAQPPAERGERVAPSARSEGCSASCGERSMEEERRWETTAVSLSGSLHLRRRGEQPMRYSVSDVGRFCLSC